MKQGSRGAGEAGGELTPKFSCLIPNPQSPVPSTQSPENQNFDSAKAINCNNCFLVCRLSLISTRVVVNG